MAYVDLNPVRAGIAVTPETFDYTSIKARLAGESADSVLVKAVRAMRDDGSPRRFDLALRPLMPFQDCADHEPEKTLPIRERDYLLLVDATARAQVRGKAGFLDPALPLITERLRLTEEQCLEGTAESTPSEFRREASQGRQLTRLPRPIRFGA